MPGGGMTVECEGIEKGGYDDDIMGYILRFWFRCGDDLGSTSSTTESGTSFGYWK